MSIETEIQKLTAAILELSFAYRDGGNTKGASAMTAAAGELQGALGAGDTPAPKAEETPTPAAGMPDLPDFTKPPVETAAPVPFTDNKGLTAYTIEAYTTLGAEKGAGVQLILQELGHSTISEVRPDQYATYFAKVEQLKTA